MALEHAVQPDCFRAMPNRAGLFIDRVRSVLADALV